MFLEPHEVRQLTGRAFKGQQIDALKRMGIPFYVNAAGRPVVVRKVLEGKCVQEDVKPKAWTPRLVKA